MNSRERVLCALKKGIPDAVPYMYSMIDRELQEQIIENKIQCKTVTPVNSWGFLGKPGEKTKVDPVLTISPEVVRFLNLDAIGIQILPPLFVESKIDNNRSSILNGLLNTRESFKMAEMPDPDDDGFYKRIQNLIESIEGEQAIYARIRIGASPTLLSMGMEGFSYNLVDEPELVSDVLEMYCNWSRRVCNNLNELNFDFFWCFDDMAFNTSPMFSKQVLKDFFLPNMRKVCSMIKKPWVFHSDGNLTPFLDELISLGMDGLHPLEPGAMDLDYLKNEYGNILCLIGNIDIDKTLTRGTVKDVEREVKERIKQLGYNGGFIISDSNSVPSYCKKENVIAMSNAVEKYRYVY